MSEYIQIGVTALRDPATGGFLPSVPLYIRAEDQDKCAVPVFDAEAVYRQLAQKIADYKKAERKMKKQQEKKKDPEAIEDRIMKKLEEYRKEKESR